jgi:hypothetical protein
MVSFIHIADKNDEQAILQSGITATKRRTGVRGVYATPVVPNFATTHQWARELKRRGVKTLICVQFKIPDDESVLVGKYNGDKLQMTAAEALGAVPRPHGRDGFRSDHSPQRHPEGDQTDVSCAQNHGLAILSRCQRKTAERNARK